MPKPTPEILIQADIREARSGIPDLLAKIDHVQVEVTRLELGDYLIGGEPLRAIERKSASDFILSIHDQRLFAQTTALLDAGTQPILLLEGDPLAEGSHSAMQPAAIRGAMTYLAGVQGIPILPSPDPAESALLIHSLARQLQTGVARPTLLPQRKAVTLPGQQLNVMLALPGIGKATAQALFQHFVTLQAVAQATVEDLMVIPGISRRRAEQIVAIWTAAYIPGSVE